MTITYKLVKDLDGREGSITKKINGVKVLSIPYSEGNTDYIEWKEWEAAGNTTEAAD
tara:strand:+ start:2102 stop:2272 length:171 start_codon:yes stop_codon:yes gene_type:complete